MYRGHLFAAEQGFEPQIPDSESGVIPFHHSANIPIFYHHLNLFTRSDIINAMTIREIYEKYKLMPNLQEHQMRVAGVGYFITKNWNDKSLDIDKEVKACLLHDMGNTVKFDLSEEKSRQMGFTDNLDYWREVQQEYFEKYGHDAHEATIAILREMNLPEMAELMVVEFVSWHEKKLDSLDNLYAKILAYSDLRVAPNSVVSMKERIDDLCRRYNNKPDDFTHCYVMEKQIQENTSIDLQEITEEKVRPLFKQFLEMEI